MSPAAINGLEENRADFFQVLLYSFAIFLGSFLLFLLEPLYAKLILPWFGGTSSVWALCLAFFQSALLLGYGYADFTTRHLPPPRRSLVHIGLLAACLCFLPIHPDPSWRPHAGSDPTLLILGLLVTRIGMPFVLLSASSPLIQSWYSRRLPDKKPFILFALSNAASLLGLLAFVFLLEPHLSTSGQVSLWSWLFGVYVAVCSFAAWQSRNETTVPSQAPQEPDRSPSLPFRDRLAWAGLSAGGSMLLLAITNHLTQDVAPVPYFGCSPSPFT